MNNFLEASLLSMHAIPMIGIRMHASIKDTIESIHETNNNLQSSNMPFDTGGGRWSTLHLQNQ